MSKQTITSIMWVLYSQSYHFAAGLMTTTDTPGSLRDDFIHMITCIKTTQTVFNGDVLPHIYLPPLIDPSNSSTANPNSKKKRDDSIGNGDKPNKTIIIKMQHYTTSHSSKKHSSQYFIIKKAPMYPGTMHSSMM